MYFFEIIIKKCLLVAVFCSALLCSFSEPFLAPNDPFIRHEIRYLGDESGLDGVQNTWPLNLGGISAMLNKDVVEAPSSLLDNRLSTESDSGWSPIFTTIGVADDRVTARGFGPEPRSSFATNASVSWMNDRFAAKLSLNAFYGMEKDWMGRVDEGFALDGSYIAARLGNWSASFGQQERWWGPGWDGSLILSTNARPIPAISVDRRVPEPFESKWLSWIGPWSFHSFVGRMEKERTVANPYLWGMRGEVKPTILNGLEVGFFRIIQLGGDGRPEGLSTWLDAFLSQDNYGANTGNNDLSKEPGNQLAGIDLRWKVMDAPIALYGQLVGEDEDNFLPNALIFQYGVESWLDFEDFNVRLFVEYADLTSTWWNGANRHVTYDHHIYKDGYRYRGRPIGHWADQDSQIISLGSFVLGDNGNGWGVTLRTGKLNEDGRGSQSSVSANTSTDYFSLNFKNARRYQKHNLAVNTSFGWESMNPAGGKTDDGLVGYLTLTRSF